MEVIQPLDRRGFSIAIICALPIEANYVVALFDRFWEDEGRNFGKVPGDSNQYTTGVISGHNVVLAHMPGMGKVNAATVASDLRTSFVNIKLAIVVGICGGLPIDRETGNEIILGDVVISQALVQYDFGRHYPHGFRRKDGLEDSLPRPSHEVRAILAKLQTARLRENMQDDIFKSLANITQKFPAATYPGSQNDKLYQSSYIHQHHSIVSRSECGVCSDNNVCSVATHMSCERLQCDDQELVVRHRLTSSGTDPIAPMVHFGKMGSGDSVMKSGELRDQIAEEDGIIAFEMEGAGVWEKVPTIVMKGLCDYADSHKNKIWQPYAAATAASCLKAFLKILTTEDVGEPRAVPSHHLGNLVGHNEANERSIPVPVWHVPFDQMQDFIGREALVRNFKEKLFQSTQGQKVAMFGLGGVGKSRVALELANHARTIGYSVLWVQATNVSTLENDYMEIGRKLKIPAILNARNSDVESSSMSRVPDAQRGQFDVKTVVKQWLSLEESGRWLMILDNADDESIWLPRFRDGGDTFRLLDYLPTSPLGSMFVTTRSRKIAIQLAKKNVTELSQMNADEAVEVLNSLLLECEAENEEHAQRDSASLVRQLSYLPLAIVQAAAYLNMNGLSIRDYLDLLKDAEEQDIIQLLSEDFEDDTRYRHTQNSIASTWLISFKQIQKSNVKAMNFLSYMSCLNEKDIPKTLLPETDSKKEFSDIVGALTAYSFIRKQPQERSGVELYDMHRLVRLATRNWLRSQDLLQHWIETAIKRVHEQFPTGKLPQRSLWTLYMPHAEMLCSVSNGSNLTERYRLIRRIALCLKADGEFERAAHQLSFVLTWWLQQHKENSIEALQVRGDLGHALTEAGIWAESAKHLKIALEGQEKMLGPDTRDTLITRGRLATAFRQLGRLSDALELEERVLESSRRVCGPEHPDTIASMGYLAAIYVQARQWEKAEKLESQALEISIRTCGRGHQLTTASMVNLSTIYSKLGRYKEAEKLCNEAIVIVKEQFGKEHPYTLRAVTHLVGIYEQQGKWDLAEKLILELLDANTKILGAQNPDTIEMTARLGNVYTAQRRYEEALPLDEKTLDLSQKVLGPDHPRTLSRMEDLAGTLKNLGQMWDAYLLIRHCVELSTEQLGRDDQATITRRRRARRWLETMQHQKKPLVIRTKSF